MSQTEALGQARLNYRNAPRGQKRRFRRELEAAMAEQLRKEIAERWARREKRVAD